MRIVFMGTPEFAIPSLDILIRSGHDVVGVVTAVDKMGGRGNKKVLQSAIKRYAQEQHLNILQPKNLKSKKFLKELKALHADIQIVVAFRMLPEVVWDMPPMGTFNLHGSLLPKYRGAAPIHWAVINGETETGVTSFKLKHAIDTGDYLFQRNIPIGLEENTGDIHDKMMLIGAQVVLNTVNAVQNETATLTPQDDQLACKAPKLTREICEIDFSLDGNTIHNFIRGLSPYPTAWTTLANSSLKIFRAKFIPAIHFYPTHKYLTDRKDYLHITCKDGYINVLELQLEGRRKMNVVEFLNGTRTLKY